MRSIRPEEISAKENYKLLTGAVIPRPIAFVTTLSTVNETINAAPFSYFNMISSNPPLLSISVQRVSGNMKDTARNAVDRGEFVVHVCSEHTIEEINKTAATLDPAESELALTSLHSTPSLQISVPGIKEAPIRFECKLEKHLTFLGEKNIISTDLLIGRIVCYHLAEEVYDPEKGYVHAEKVKPVSRLAGDTYAKLGELFSLKRPK
ncbi:flavin reductase family protein [Aneurinibacillus sp. Ricciae_BoGa-3]|uniref:flavin reductase family protein n=1 Tax=Aneurinibacillus sp. Ricciae_BoGa-3 TaxID=3022697 RepID=UPI002342307F|nr:flavin reductase family protein [Aneurinibacillus sp. Ricciae_BoGa-3]WCK52668.1 flavin reductase family protein [Aneurinibacillus sp. Ricciae_BoGa-3]